jgi:hypothetical protein
VTEPTLAEETVEKITGAPATSRQWSYRERRKELLLAMLDQHADSLDAAVDELGRWVDHLRQVGIRGFIAEHTNDPELARIRPSTAPDETAPPDMADQDERAGTESVVGKPGGR